MNLLSLDQTIAAMAQAIACPSPEFSIALDQIVSGYILIEQEYLTSSFPSALTPFEQSLAKGFGERRTKSFIAARISLKLLAYKLGLANPEAMAGTLETVNRTDRRPLLPGADGIFFASVSHDKRFTLVVAGKRPLGVDIEAISPKAVKAGHFFMTKEEIAIAGSAALDMALAATMVWTAKEAAAKAFNLQLVAAWRAVRLLKLGREESIFDYGGDELAVSHLFQWDRVVSLISVPVADQSTNSIAISDKSIL